MNLKWLNEGKLKYQEKVYHGFENMVDALVGMLRGENTGKAVVKVKWNIYGINKNVYIFIF